MKLKHKITGGLLSVFLLAILISAYSIFALSSIQGTAQELSNLTDSREQFALLDAYISQTTAILLGLVGVIVIVFAALSLLIPKSILAPIKRLSQIASEVSKGHLHVNMDLRGGDDEIGVLSTNIARLVTTLQSFMTDLTDLERADARGEIEHRIDPNKYQNAFYDMASGVNNIVNGTVSDVVMCLTALGKLTQGEFDIEFPDMPGQKMLMPQTMRELVQRLQAVNENINAMIHSATHKDADLSFRIDTTAYTGDWETLMTGLNHLAQSVASPVAAIDIWITEMAAGNFDLEKLDQKIRDAGYSSDIDDYSGVFRNVVLHLEQVTSEFSDYIFEITKDINLIGGGDLTTVITREFIGDFKPIKDGLNILSDRLKETVTGIVEASDQVLEGAVQVASSAVEIANGATRQAATVEELTGTLEIINNQTLQNKDNANLAHDLSNQSTDNAHKGNDAMQDMLVAMEGIKDSSDNISKIIQVIQDIAFQTNLLALNASVEAARAGEHGKGFAVVADEVRSLASRSQTAAVETTGLIEDSVNRVGTGSSIAQTTAGSLTAIVANADEVLSVINSIAHASSEQAIAISAVTAGISEISAVLQNNVAVTEETTAASEELNAQADMLKQLVSYFKV